MKSAKEKYDELVNYLKDKSIVVIGSGASILKKEYGTFIDGHDVVVRINRGYPYKRYRKYVGTRTDIWAFGMGGREDLRSKMHQLFKDRKYSLYTWFESSWVPNYLRIADNHITLPPHFSMTAMKQCGGKPATTGADTVHFLATGTEYKNITILGIDCYQTGYWFIEEDDSISIACTTQEEVKKQKRAHQVDDEELFLQNLVDNYRDIKWIK